MKKKSSHWKGMRHQKGLPVRGQRTKSHFRKNKGKVVGVAKKSSSCRRRRKERSKEIGKSWEIQKQLRKSIIPQDIRGLELTSKANGLSLKITA